MSHITNQLLSPSSSFFSLKWMVTLDDISMMVIITGIRNEISGVPGGGHEDCESLVTQ